MGAGLSKKQINQRKYTRLKAIQRELERAGVAVLYQDQGLRPLEGLPVFQVYYGATMHASNGESAALLIVTVTTAAGMERYGGENCTAHAGIQRIKSLFGNPAPSGIPGPDLLAQQFRLKGGKR